MLLLNKSYPFTLTSPFFHLDIFLTKCNSEKLHKHPGKCCLLTEFEWIGYKKCNILMYLRYGVFEDVRMTALEILVDFVLGIIISVHIFIVKLWFVFLLTLINMYSFCAIICMGYSEMHTCNKAILTIRNISHVTKQS